jgi:transcriptional regulator with XRE-family HTH domain
VTTDENRDLGRRLRALRREKGLSLAEVANATGISKSFLSHVETGKGDITFSRLSRLVEAYDVSMMALIRRRHSAARVVRAGEQVPVASRVERVETFVLTPSTDVPFLPLLCVFEPNAESGYGTPGVVEFIHVLQGALEIEFEAGETLRLVKGDSAFLANPSESRTYRNVGRSVLKHLSVTDVRGAGGP